MLSGRFENHTPAGRFDRRTALGFSLAVSLSATAPLLWYATRPSAELLLSIFG